MKLLSYKDSVVIGKVYMLEDKTCKVFAKCTHQGANHVTFKHLSGSDIGLYEDMSKDNIVQMTLDNEFFNENLHYRVYEVSKNENPEYFL